MINLKRAIAVVGLFSMVAKADSLHPDTFLEVANSLKRVAVTEVGSEGRILRENRQHPFTQILIAVPVTLTPEDACTQFVGQFETKNQNLVELNPLGASNPLVENCIQIFPPPIDTHLTLSMSVLTGGFVPAARFHRQLVQLGSAGIHVVQLDLHENRVKIEPMIRHHRK